MIHAFLPIVILGIATGLSMSLTAGLLANRGGYMTGFRSHDVNFAIQLNLSKVVGGEAGKAHRQNGKAWAASVRGLQKRGTVPDFCRRIPRFCHYFLPGFHLVLL